MDNKETVSKAAGSLAGLLGVYLMGAVVNALLQDRQDPLPSWWIWVLVIALLLIAVAIGVWIPSTWWRELAGFRRIRNKVYSCCMWWYYGPEIILGTPDVSWHFHDGGTGERRGSVTYTAKVNLSLEKKGCLSVVRRGKRPIKVHMGSARLRLSQERERKNNGKNGNVLEPDFNEISREIWVEFGTGGTPLSFCDYQPIENQIRVDLQRDYEWEVQDMVMELKDVERRKVIPTKRGKVKISDG